MQLEVQGVLKCCRDGGWCCRESPGGAGAARLRSRAGSLETSEMSVSVTVECSHFGVSLFDLVVFEAP